MIPPVWINFVFNRIWVPIPVFLFWPVFIVAWLIIGVLSTGALLAAGGKGSEVMKTWTSVWAILCSLRGTRIEVEQSDVRLNISII